MPEMKQPLGTERFIAVPGPLGDHNKTEIKFRVRMEGNSPSIA
jgi:hypothetical protein